MYYDERSMDIAFFLEAVLIMGGLFMMFLLVFLPFYSIYFLARMIQARRRGVPWADYKQWWE